MIWYQIFPERFNCGNKNVNPDLDSIGGSYPHDLESPFEIHPWNSDWYEIYSYENDDIWFSLQRRRYGGDIQGIIDRISYLKELGITGIYLNPIFDAPSSHKYDGRLYHHIDPTFGPDPDGDREIIKNEIFTDPSSWKWTEADKLFLRLVKLLHCEDIKIILDGVFNHLGIDSIPFRDVLKNKRRSKFKKWFTIRKYGNGKNPLKGGWKYKSWKGFRELPELKQDENGLIREIREYIFHSVKRWMKPDGILENGIDGWRLDVAGCIKHPFWKKFRKFIKKINPDAIMVGELFGDVEYLKPYLMGDEFDSIMNYNFTFVCTQFFIEKRISSKEFEEKIMKLANSFSKDVTYSMQNLLSSHDSSRISTHIFNRGKFDYKNWEEYWKFSKGNNRKYDTSKPDNKTERIKKLMIFFQMFWIGSPMIYYGDEAGMWGANDPCCRKPMVWYDMEYDDEKINSFGEKYPQKSRVEFDYELFSYYKKLIKIRNQYDALNIGECSTFLIREDLYGFQRKYGDETLYIIINNSEKSQMVEISEIGSFTNLLNGDVEIKQIRIEPVSGVILKKIV